jgi:hypothetical protein
LQSAHDAAARELDFKVVETVTTCTRDRDARSRTDPFGVEIVSCCGAASGKR